MVEGTRIAAAGESGILARSGYLPLGYYRDPVKTAETIVTVDGAGYKVPKEILTVPEVLRSAAGKANYVWAKEVAQNALASAAQAG